MLSDLKISESKDINPGTLFKWESSSQFEYYYLFLGLECWYLLNGEKSWRSLQFFCLTRLTVVWVPEINLRQIVSQ